jgi:long-chain-fatty-acid--CoA ligase ACSBG
MWTWNQYNHEVFRFAKSLGALNVTEKSAVAIMGFNAPEWVFACWGAIMANCVFTGIYVTNEAEACFYQVDHSEAEVICVETIDHLKRFTINLDRLPRVKAFVVWGEKKIPDEFKSSGKVYLWEDFQKLGESTPESLIQARIEKQKAGECCCLIYTSGTTGNPKGCMLSHDNLIWETLGCMHVSIETDPSSIGPHMRFLSYLPLSHIAGFWADVMVHINYGC